MFESLKTNTDLSPVDTDIKGLTEEEVFDRGAQMQEAPEPEGSLVTEGLGYFRFDTLIGAVGEKVIDQYDEEYDPEFDVFTELESQGIPMQEYDKSDQDILADARNKQHLAELQNKVNDRQKYRENAQHLGVTSKLAVDFGMEAFNLFNYIPIIGVAKNISRVKKAATVGLQAGAQAGLEEAALSRIYTDRGVSDIVGGILMGGAFGSAAGALIKPSPMTSAQETVAKDLYKAGEKIISEGTFDRIKAPEGSAGAMRLDPYEELTGKVHAQFRGDEADPTVMEAFNKMVDGKLPKMKGKLRPDAIVGMGESLQRSDNPLARYIGSKVIEHGEGTGGKVTAEHSADLLSDIYFHNLGVKYSQDYINNSGMFKADIKKKGLNVSFDDAVYKEINAQELGLDSAIEKLENPEPWQIAVRDHAYRIGQYNKRLYDLGKKAGVTEFQQIKSNEFYLVRQYDAKKMVNLSNAYGKENVIRLIQKAILTSDHFETKFNKVPEGKEVPDIEETALNMAKAVFNRMSNRSIHTGADANILQTSDKRLLRDALDDANIPKEQRDHINYILDTAGKDRFSNPNKSRISMNMTAEHSGMTMMDLLDTDLAKGYVGHIRKWAGRAALAEKGFNDRGVFENALDSMKQVGKSKGLIKQTQKDYDRLNASWDLIQGVPIDKDIDSASKKGMRALRKLAAVSKLGKLTFAQVTETGRAVAAVGILRTLEGIPAFKGVIRNAKTGKLSDSFLNDIEAAGYGRIGDEYMLTHKDFRVEELHEGAFPGERVLDDMNYKLGKYTGFYAVQTMQKRLFARQYGMKLWKEITTDKLSEVVRNDLGITKRQQKLIKDNMNKHAELKSGLFRGQNVANLNVRDWQSEARGVFIAALHKKSSNAIQKLHVGDLPRWAHKSWGQFLAQFRTFGLASGGKHGVHDYRMAKSGNLEGVNAFLFNAMLASLVYIAKTEVDSFGLDPSKRKKFLKNRLSTKRIVKNAGNYLSQLGLAFDTSQFLLGSLAPQVLGDDITYSRTGIVGAAESVPSFSYLDDAFKAVSSGTRAVTSDYDFTNTDLKAAWSIIPFNNIIGMTNLRDKIGDKYFE